MTERTHHRLRLAALWTGRALSLLLFLFWGAFFVEHMGEWFMGHKGEYPPPRVWVAQALHGAMVVGFLLMVKWDRMGTVVMAAATIAFFALIGMSRFPWIAMVNLLPVPFLAGYWWLSRAQGK
jgi:hypothetical protein